MSAYNNKEITEHINFVLFKEIDISLLSASELAFELLKDADVDDDKLLELEYYFREAILTLASWNSFIKQATSIDDCGIENISKLYPNLN